MGGLVVPQLRVFNEITTQKMTIEFLTQSPSSRETTEKLKRLVEHEEGRIFLLTGNLSVKKFETSRDELLTLMQWASEKPNRELVILVGVFMKYYESEPNENTSGPTIDAQKRMPSKGVYKLNTDEVAEQLATLVHEVEKRMLEDRSGTFEISLSFHAVKKWHAKAIGLSGPGKRFRDAKCAIFGSTNFSDSALGGETFEIDLYMDGKTSEGQALLNAFIDKTGSLIRTAFAGGSRISNFEGLVLAKMKALGSSYELVSNDLKDSSTEL